MRAALKLPRLSTNMEEGTIAAWKVAIGDRFVTGDPLYEVETEKVTTEVEAPCDGTVGRDPGSGGRDGRRRRRGVPDRTMTRSRAPKPKAAGKWHNTEEGDKDQSS